MLHLLIIRGMKRISIRELNIKIIVTNDILVPQI